MRENLPGSCELAYLFSPHNNPQIATTFNKADPSKVALLGYGFSHKLSPNLFNEFASIKIDNLNALIRMMI